LCEVKQILKHLLGGHAVLGVVAGNHKKRFVPKPHDFVVTGGISLEGAIFARKLPASFRDSQEAEILNGVGENVSANDNDRLIRVQHRGELN
jgi:hypothetical protein